MDSACYAHKPAYISVIIVIPQMESNKQNNPNPLWAEPTPGSNILLSALPQGTRLSAPSAAWPSRWSPTSTLNLSFCTGATGAVTNQVCLDHLLPYLPAITFCHFQEKIRTLQYGGQLFTI